MSIRVSLADMRAGETGKIVEIRGGYGMIRKLETLGIKEGREIRKLSSQFMRGPVMLQVGNTRVGIGFGMAQRILVEMKSVDV